MTGVPGAAIVRGQTAPSLGRSHEVGEPVPDDVFRGLFPEIDPTVAGHACVECWAMAGIVTVAEAQDLNQLGAAGEEFERMVTEMRSAVGAGLPGGEMLADPVFQVLDRGRFAEVTGFGRYCLAGMLRAHGHVVPAVGDLVDVPPGEFLEMLHSHDPAAAAQEVRGWLDACGEDWAPAVRDAFAELVERLDVESMLAAPGGMAAAKNLDHPNAREVLRELVEQLDDRDLAGRLRRAVRGRGRR